MNQQPEEDNELIYKRPYCLINDKGKYFEEYTRKLTNVLKYPKYEYLVEHLNEITSGNQVIYLHNAQEKEIKLMKSYILTFKLQTYMGRIIDKFIPGAYNYDEEQLLKLAETYKKRYTWLSIFVFGRINKKYDLNPSLLLTTKPTRHIWEAYNLKQITEPKAKKYLESTDNFNPIIFLELITADLLEKETPESKALEKFLKLKNQEDFSEKEIGIPKQLLEVLFREGEIYKPSENKICRWK